MSGSSRVAAFIAYLLGPLGWLYVLLFRRDDRYAVYHTKQSIALAIFMLAAPAVWAVVAWVLTWVPKAGGVTAAMLFPLVILAYFIVAVDWIIGMARALRGRARPLPIVGATAQKLPIQTRYPSSHVAERVRA